MSIIEPLTQLGISTWMRHSPIHLSDKVHLYFDKQFISPRCLVVLPVRGLQSPPKLSDEAETIFEGMIKVLALQESEMIHVRLAISEMEAESHQQINALIHLFQPQHVLFFSRHKAFKIDDTYNRTFHPEQLVKQPEQKKIAYQDLLAMRTKLEVKND